MTDKLQTLTQTVRRTESIVSDLNGQFTNLKKALELVVLSNDILDQVKRVIFYRTSYNESKLNSLVEKLATITTADFSYGGLINGTDDQSPEIEPRIVHGIVGANTESAELASALLKYLETGEIDKVNTGEEIGDALYYFTLLSDAIEVPIDQCITAVQSKLNKRYPIGFTTDAAVNREVDIERELLEEVITPTH